jgi:hypothetical protein
MRANALFQNSSQFRPNTGKNRGGGKQGKNFRWSFRVHRLSFTRWVVVRLQESCLMTKHHDGPMAARRDKMATMKAP